MNTNPQDLQILPATEADFISLAHIQSTCDPRMPITANELKASIKELKENPKQPIVNYWIAQQNKVLVGMAYIKQYPWIFHQDRYHAHVTVLSDFERQGIGTQLIHFISAQLEKRQAREIIADAYEDQPHAIHILHRLGFKEAIRYYDNVLQLSKFDPQLWAHTQQLQDGLRITSVAQLIQELGAQEAIRILYDCYCEARIDVPRPSPPSEITFEAYQKRQAQAHILPQAQMLAMTLDNKAVALSELLLKEAKPQRLDTGLTGTRRAWRRKGLGLALKVAGLKVAKEMGIQEIWTENATDNMAILELNKRLGFKALSPIIEFKKGQV